jgi:hypothetical protein
MKSSGVGQQCLPVLLSVILILPPHLLGQQPTAPAQPPTFPTVQSLTVIPLAGNLGVNDLERGVMTPLVVQVLDQNSRPVEGAQVIFRFPLNGPSAEFPNKQTSQTVRTNADGQAAAVGWVANREVGSFQVQVTATRGNELGSVSMTMTNANRIVGAGGAKDKHKSVWSSKWTKIAIVAGAAGAVAGIVLATRSGNGGGTTVTASPGSPTIGGPH